MDQVEKSWNRIADSDVDAWMDRPSGEPFGSIMHLDMWSNNTMQVFQNGKLLKNVLLDFQSFLYCCPVNDMIFFIWSSIQKNVVLNHYEELIRHYHKYLYDTLKGLGCDTSSFEYAKFLDRIEDDAPYEFTHLLFMAVPIKGPIGESVMNFEVDDWRDMVTVTSRDAKEQIAFIVEHFGRRGWLRIPKKVN